MKLIGRIFVITLLACMVGCANRKNYSPVPSIDPEVQANLDARVNCASARKDIIALEEEKASVGKQVLSGVRSVLPIAAVAGILMGDYSDRVQVATGQYNRDIETKVSQIRKVCGVS